MVAKETGIKKRPARPVGAQGAAVGIMKRPATAHGAQQAMAAAEAAATYSYLAGPQTNEIGAIVKTYHEPVYAVGKHGGLWKCLGWSSRWLKLPETSFSRP